MDTVDKDTSKPEKTATTTETTTGTVESPKVSEDFIHALGISLADKAKEHAGKLDAESISKTKLPPSDEGWADKKAKKLVKDFKSQKREVHNVGDLTEDQLKLLNTLDEVNGQDAYSNESAGLGKITVDEYLVLPDGYYPPEVHPYDVGRDDLYKEFAKRDLAQIYALNKAAAPVGTNAVVYGMIRMEAVKMGWVFRQREIRYAPPIDAAVDIFLNDLRGVINDIAKFRKAAFLIPLCAEFVFRTTGHHYLTTLAANYADKYASLLRACLSDEITNLLSPSIQWHALLHWVSPARSYRVMKSLKGTDRLPEALNIRSTAPPAGTALITTTSAVISAIEACGLGTEVERLSGVSFKAIKAATEVIKEDPARYHKTPYAYEFNALSDEVIAMVDAVKKEASKFAPVAQGFIDALFKSSPLGRAMALKKAAGENPMLMKRSAKFFKTYAKSNVATLADVFPKKAVG